MLNATTVPNRKLWPAKVIEYRGHMFKNVLPEIFHKDSFKILNTSYSKVSAYVAQTV